MNHAEISSIVPAESMTVIVLILLAAVAKAIRSLSKRLSLSRLTLETDSSTLSLRIQPHSSQLELQLHEQQGVDEHGNSNDDNGGIPAASQRPKL